MTLPARVRTPVRTGRPAWALVGSGGLVALAGGIWWAWDADPNRGKVLLVVGLLIALAGIALTRRTDRLPVRAVTVVAVLIVVYAAFETWQAVATIIAQGSAHFA